MKTSGSAVRSSISVCRGAMGVKIVSVHFIKIFLCHYMLFSGRFCFDGFNLFRVLV